MSSLKSKIESLLFISAKPMTVRQLTDLIKKDEKEVRQAGDELVESYKDNKCGVQIIKNGSKYQMVSSPENTKLVQDFIADETTGDLSRPSLETLTIIAYRGPISKIDLDRIRGVNCSLILRNLMIRGLIEAKADKLKEQTYYNVTLDFIRFLGINELSEMPDYERLHKDDSIERMLEGDAGNAEADKEKTVDNPGDEKDADSNDLSAEDEEEIVLEVGQTEAIGIGISDEEDDEEDEESAQNFSGAAEESLPPEADKRSASEDEFFIE